MRSILGRKPAPGTVIGIVALIVAMAGTGYAAITLPANSVRSKQIKNGQVKNADLAGSAVTSGKVKDGSLLSADFKPGQLVSGAPGAAGPTGPQGPPGAPGAKGDTGPSTGPAGGDLAGSYPNPTIAPPEAVHQVGAPGEPTFGTGWANVGGSFQTAGFYKDRQGIVHLQGDLSSTGASSDAFTLPVGYRPTALENVPGYNNGGTIAGWAIRADGIVRLVSASSSFISLSSITFRAG